MSKIEMILSKMFSARWLMTVMFTSTICYGFLKGMVETPVFITIVNGVVVFYFSKSPSDSKKESKL